MSEERLISYQGIRELAMQYESLTKEWSHAVATGARETEESVNDKRSGILIAVCKLNISTDFWKEVKRIQGHFLEKDGGAA